jgi:hypothetical protein
MKYILTKEEFEKLPEALQGEYKLEGENATLTLEGHEDAFVEKGKWQEAEKHRKNAETKALEVEKREAQLLKDIEAAKGNEKKIAELRESHEAEVARIKEENEAQLKEIKASQHRALIDAEATKFANEHFTVPSIMKDAFAKRITVEEIDGQPVLRALEADGKASSKSLEQVQKEFLENKEFSSIIKASKGKGGGATPPEGGKGGGATKQVTRAEFDGMSQAERLTFSKEGGEVVDGA